MQVTAAHSSHKSVSRLANVVDLLRDLSRSAACLLDASSATLDRPVKSR